jgi:hypothetical protein
VRNTGIAVAAVVGAALSFATSAAATTSQLSWDCPSDALACLYDGGFGDGDRYVVRAVGEYNLPVGYRDKISSLYNTLAGQRIVLLNWHADWGQYVPVWDHHYQGPHSLGGTQGNNVADRIRIEP